MPRLTKEMYWLAQDMFCRYVAQNDLAPKGDIKQIAQTCIALTSEFFAAFEGTQSALAKTEQRALARDLPKALGDALLVESNEVAKALLAQPAKATMSAPDDEGEEEEEEEEESDEGDRNAGGGLVPKAWAGKRQEPPAKAPAPTPLPSTSKASSPAPGEAPKASLAPPAKKVARRKK